MVTIRLTLAQAELVNRLLQEAGISNAQPATAGRLTLPVDDVPDLIKRVIKSPAPTARAFVTRQAVWAELWAALGSAPPSSPA